MASRHHLLFWTFTALITLSYTRSLHPFNLAPLVLNGKEYAETCRREFSLVTVLMWSFVDLFF